MNTYLWHQDPNKKNLFEAEISALHRGLNGDFELLDLPDPANSKGVVKALGYLIFSNDRKQLIEIIFPTKYPYAPAKIIPFQVIGNNWREQRQPLALNKGNQYNDRSMCLMEKHTWGKPEHTVGWLLRRAQKWLRSAHSLEGFKKEEIIQERLTVFPHEGQVLSPEGITIPPHLERGAFSLTPFKPNHYLLEINTLPVSPFALKLPPEEFQWFRFSSDVTLKKLLKNNIIHDIHHLLLENFQVDVLGGRGIQNIALFFPQDDPQWHFFKIIKQGTNLNLKYFLYHEIKEELYLRTKDIFDDQLLSKKKVTLIGLGAIGSEVGKSLAKNGIGHFNLFDHDSFEIGNLVRHAADLFYLGEPKTEVLRQLIQRCNPNITVNCFPIDILEDNGNLEKQLQQSDLCIVLAGEEAVDYLVNDQYFPRFKIPFLFARVSAGAASGSIQVVDKKTPCLRCLSRKGKDTLPKPNGIVADEELETELGSCSRPAVPGSEIDTKEIALQVTRIALQLLLGNHSSKYPPLRGKQFYWNGPYGSGKNKPYSWSIHNFRKSFDCSICK